MTRDDAAGPLSGDTTRSERAALEAWLAAWYPSAYRTARLILGSASEAEDAVQDACLRLWRFRDAIPSGDGARAWRYRVLVNACISTARRERRRLELPGSDELLAEARAPEAGPDDLAAREDAGAEVRRAILALPESLRVPTVLRYFAELSEREIATAIGRRSGTVKSRLHEARRRLGGDPALGALGSEAVP